MGRWSRAAAALFILASLPAFSVTVHQPCASPGSFFVHRDANEHVFLSFSYYTGGGDHWNPPVAAVHGTSIEVTERVFMDDEIFFNGCETQTVDLGVLSESTYDVVWTLDEATMLFLSYPVSHSASFTIHAPSCGQLHELMANVNPYAPNNSQSVQIDVSELTRAASYDPPSVSRNGSHITIQQTEHVNSIAVIETQAPYACHGRTFILGRLPAGDYDVTITQPIDDPAANGTASTTLSFHVNADPPRRHSARH